MIVTFTPLPGEELSKWDQTISRCKDWEVAKYVAHREIAFRMCGTVRVPSNSTAVEDAVKAYHVAALFESRRKECPWWCPYGLWVLYLRRTMFA